MSEPALITASPEPARGSAPSPGSASPPPSAHDLRWWWVVVTLLAVVALTGFLFAWRADQRLGALEKELVRRQQQSADQAAEARMLAKQAEQGMRETSAKVALVEVRLSEVAIQRTQLEELIQSLSRSRDENLVVDIEAAIRVALQQAALTGSAEPLVATLRQSDERLARYNQPRLENVRRSIARDLDRVRAVGVTDIAALTIRLDEAMRMVDELPLLSGGDPRTAGGTAVRAAPAPGAASSPAPTAATGGLGALRDAWSAQVARWTGLVWAEARSLVRVARIENPDAVLLQPEHAFFVRENLKLRLLNARLSLLSRQFAVAQADLAGAQTMLERYFDRNAKRTLAATDLVRQVAAQARQVGLPRPDDTLAALAAAAAGR